MKNNIKNIVAAVVALVPFTSTLAADSSTPDHRHSKTLAIATIGINDQSLVVNTTNYLSINLSSPIRYAGHQASPSTNLNEAIAQISTLKLNDDIAIIGIINIPEDVAFQKAVVPSKNVALVNIQSLSSGLDLTNADQRATYTRRIFKQIMNVAGQLVGLEPCIFPQCAMVPTATLEQLDAKGANFCPPCWGKVEKQLRALGIVPLSDR